MERIKQLALDEYLLEQKEGNILQIIRRAFEEGDQRELLSKIRTARRLIKGRERRITFRLISEAKRRKINVYGRPIDIFEKELLKNHDNLYRKLGEMIKDNEPVNLIILESLISEALEIEKKIINDLRGLIVELKKT